MKKFVALTIAALIGLTTVVAATPAQAQPPALSAQGGQFNDSCSSVSISYYFQDDNFPLDQWDLTVDVFAPNGSFSDTDSFAGTGSVASGTMDAFICQFEGLGNYRVEANINWHDEEYDTTLATYSASTTFLMTMPPSPPVKSRAQTATTMTVSDTTPRRGQKVTIKVRSTVRATTTWKPNRSAYVVLEKRTNHGWVKWSGMKKMTSGQGKATWKTRWVAKKPVQVRAVTLGTSTYFTSNSRAKRIK